MNTHAEIYAKLEAGTITGKQAIEALVAMGMSQYEAHENVFISLGGDDVTEIQPDGTERYAISGKTVDEVNAAMGDAPEEADDEDDPAEP